MQVKGAVLEYLKEKDEENKRSLIEKRKEFTKEIDLYLQTEWKRIKLETVGKMKNRTNIDTWDDIHKGYEKEYE